MRNWQINIQDQGLISFINFQKIYCLAGDRYIPNTDLNTWSIFKPCDFIPVLKALCPIYGPQLPMLQRLFSRFFFFSLFKCFIFIKFFVFIVVLLLYLFIILCIYHCCKSPALLSENLPQLIIHYIIFHFANSSIDQFLLLSGKVSTV